MLSFCTTCRNRLWQLERTLGYNLERLGDNEISLVDYGSTDGMADWVWSNFRGEIEAGRLRFFEVTNHVSWSIAQAKNLAHRMATGDYLFSLDADNFIRRNDVAMVAKAAEMGVASHQSDSMRGGSFGRIGLPRALFHELGGYDENLLSMGGEDVNLMDRVKALGLKIVKLAPTQPRAVQQTRGQSMAEAGGDLPDEKTAVKAFMTMTHLNLAVGRRRVRAEGPRYAGGFASFEGRLNGKPVTIDGFDVIRPLEDAGAAA